MGWTTKTAAVSVLLAMDEHRKQAGARVARLREAKGWSQEDLAHETRLSTKTISRFENGKHEGRRETIKRIAEALQVTEIDVLGEPPDVLGLNTPRVAQAEQLDQIIHEFHARVDYVEACLENLAERADRNQQLLVAILEMIRGTAEVAGFQAPPIHPVAERILSEPSPAPPERMPRGTGSRGRSQRRAS